MTSSLHSGGPLVVLEDVSLTLGSAAGPVNILRGVSLEIAAGETVSLVGPSGSGKSTLMMVVGGLERASAGRVRVDGHDLGALNEDALARLRRDRMGIVFQAFHLIPTMTALENVALPLELPLSTIIMLRSVMQIARSQGEEIENPETALSCLQVFALGARTGEGDVLGNGYFAVRATLAKTLTEAGRFIAERGIVAEGAPVIVRFISQIASRFGMVVTQKLAAQTLPLIGALGGAAVNYTFITHFQKIAQAHFTVRRLERICGKELVRTQYERIRDELVGEREFAA